VAPDGTVYAANDDQALPAVLVLDSVDNIPYVFYDFFPDVPRAIERDSAGNIYTALDNDVIAKSTPTGATSDYRTVNGSSNGLGVVDGATPAAGYFLADNGTLQSGDCLAIQTGASAYLIVEVRTDNTACANAACGGPISATPTACVQNIGGNEAAQVTALATYFESQSGTTGMSAFALTSNNCANLAQGRNQGKPCVYFVAKTKGPAPTPVGGQPVTLRVDTGNWRAVNINYGAEAATLYAVTNNQMVNEIQIAPSTSTGEIRSWDFQQWLNNNGRDVAAVVRRAKADAVTLAERLFVYVASDQRITGYIAAADYAWTLADNTQFGPNNNDRLNSVHGIVYVPAGGGGGDCLLVANNRQNANLAGEVVAYTDLEHTNGNPVLPEGNAAIVTGLASVRGITIDRTNADPNQWSLIVADQASQIVVRIGRSLSTTDCF